VKALRSPRIADALGLAAVLGFGLLFASRNVQHLTNTWYGDVEFSGWSSGPAELLRAGGRPYQDFLLPIPPGSFYLLELAAALGGGVYLRHELWLCALCHVAMGGAAWALVRALGYRREAPLVALATLAMVMGLSKECAYDHTAQVVAWFAIAAGARARARGAGFFVSGLLSGLCHLFKQSTGVGLLLGWIAAFAYLGWISRGERAERARVLRDGSTLLVGVVVGFALTLAAVVVRGGSLRGFLHTVYVAGPALKGGSLHLIEVLYGYVMVLPALTGSLPVIVGVLLVVMRLFEREGAFDWGREAPEPGESRFGLLLVAGSLSFGLGFVLLGTRVEALPGALSAMLAPLDRLPSLALPFGLLFFIAPLLPRWLGLEPMPTAAPAHTHNAIALAAFACSLLHNTSAPELRAFYDNTPIVPFAILWGWVALRRARLPRVAAGFVVATSMSLLSGKYERALSARVAAGPGYWQGLSVPAQGRAMLRVAAEVRHRVPAGETVLVLPEDLALRPLLGRPRPDLRGAILFVDQYPATVLDEDRRRLDEHRPGAIVVHPTEARVWKSLFRIWSPRSPAEQQIERELGRLPREYRKVLSEPTLFLRSPTTLELWIRADLADAPR
jgi:hypothetical protein